VTVHYAQFRPDKSNALLFAEQFNALENVFLFDLILVPTKYKIR
jgi:hypothetical protein